MPRKYQRHTKEELQEAVSAAKSFADLCRILGKSLSGGNGTHLKLMCSRYNIDTTHFVGGAHAKGKPSPRKVPPEDRLVLGLPTDHRPKPKYLREALLNIGVPCICNVCGQGDVWNGEKLTLEVDHIDGKYWNNVPDNLQFLCPNCHSQKPMIYKTIT